MRKLLTILFALACILIGCGSSGGGDIPALPTPTPAPEATAMPTPEPWDDFVDMRNPRCRDAQQFSDGNLYKPQSDTTGNPVVLFASKFKRVFDKCKILKKDGRFESMRFSSIANGGRQHWRPSRGCKTYAGKKLGGKVVCSEPSQECTFEMKAGACKRQD